MLHPARLAAVALLFVVALIGRALLGETFADAPVEEKGPTSSPHAAGNQPIVEELTLRWQQIPGVQEAHAGYTAQGGGGLLVGYAVCRGCRLPQLQRRLVRDVWTSQLTGVTRFEVRVAHESNVSEPVTSTWDPVEDAPELYDRYGNGLVDPDTL